MPHLQGVARDQIVLFPPSLEEYISADNPVRFIDAFVDHLDLQGPGFTRVIPAETGRPSYAPDDLLKLYLYGYLNRVRSSRLLERETQRNVEVMWLLKKLTPDFKTIADFRALHSEAIKQVCREFTELCKALDIFGGELVAIDGSKFQAVNNGRPMRYYESSACRTCPLKSQCTRNKRNRRITRARYEDALDRMAQRVRDHPEIMQLRMQLAEHPFGTLKRAWHHGYFSCRGLKKVAAEMSLSVLAYNLKRAINILGVPKLVAALHEQCVLTANTILHLWGALLRRAVRPAIEFSHNLASG